MPLLQRSIAALPMGSWIGEIGGSRKLLTLLTNQLLSDALSVLLDGKYKFFRLYWRSVFVCLFGLVLVQSSNQTKTENLVFQIL